jgi:hypothetical protein
MNQSNLLLSRALQQDIALEVISKRTCLLGAVNLCIELSGLDDKEIHMTLEIDAGQWSRIRKGDAHFPLNKLNKLMDLCANEAPLIWLAQSRGKGLHELETEIQRQLREEQERTAKLEEQNKLLRELLQGKAL